MRHARKRLLSLFLVLALLMPLLPHPEPAMTAPAPLPTTNTPPMIELAGANHIETAIDVSVHGWTTSRYVVIATSQNFPDALAGAPLAHALGAPMLLTSPTSLAPAVANEVRRLSATRAIVLGGTGALSARVIDGLVAAGISRTNIERVSGANRFETARQIALRMQQASGAAQGVVIANGRNFPDALAVAGWAARSGRPILLTDSTALPAATRQALESITSTDTLIVGGTGAVSEAVAREFPGATRIGGTNRYETAALIAEHAFANGMNPQELFVATGENFPDALSAGPLLARTGFILKLTRTATLPQATKDFIERFASGTQRIVILGGRGAVSDAVRSKISEAATTRIAEGVRLVDPATRGQLVSVSPNALVFDNATPLVDDLKEGQILISEPTALAPYGYMRRVLSITSTQGNISVETTGVPIEEVLEDGSIALSQEITPASVQSVEVLAQGVEVALYEGQVASDLPVEALGGRYADAQARIPLPEFNYTITGQRINGAVLNGTIHVSGALEFICDTEDFRVNYGRIATELNQRSNIEVSGIPTAGEIELAKKDLKPFWAKVGIPILVFPTMTVSLGIDASGAVTLGFGVEQELKVRAGLEYKNGNIVPINEFTPSARFVRPSASDDAKVELYAAGRLFLKLYEFAGPYAEVKPLVEVMFNPGSDPWWLANRAIDLSAGFRAEIEILGWSRTLADVKMTWRVAEAEIDRSSPSLDRAVVFPDANLEAAIRDALNKPVGDITVGDMRGLTRLTTGAKGIRDLSGLEQAINLTSLDLSVNQISNVSPLGGLTNLTHLYLGRNQISDISPLSGLMNLTYLFIGGNQISDISPLSGLTNLISISLSDNQISNISPLSGHRNLVVLLLGYNQISAISPLSGLTNLSWLNLDANQISNIAPLGGLTNLSWLDLRANRISNISPLVGLTNLTRLHLTDNQISNISPLVLNQGLGHRDEVILRNNPLGPAALVDVQTLRARGVFVGL